MRITKKESLNVVIFMVVSLLFICFTHNAEAAKKEKRKYPHGCRVLGHEFKDGLLVLKSLDGDQPQTLFFIHNKSRSTLKMVAQKPANRPYMPIFSNKVKANQWGVFATDVPTLRFECSISSRHRSSRAVDCSKVLELCQYNNVKFADNNMGNYWVVTSDGLYRARRSAINQGILLRW